MKSLSGSNFYLSAVMTLPLLMLLFGAFEARADLEIAGAEDGSVRIIDHSSRNTIQRFETGPGKGRETFMIESETLAVVSKIDKAIIWNLSTEEPLRTHQRRIYAFTPDEKKYITYETGEDGGLFVEDARSFQIVSNIYPGDRGGPVEMNFSADGRYLAVHFNSEYPLSDEQYPNPWLDHSVDWVEMFDLSTGRAIPEFREEHSIFLGEFAEKAFYLRNSEVLISGEPWDQGMRFLPEEQRWEEVMSTGRRLGPAEGASALLEYEIFATILGANRTLGKVSIITYDPYETTDNAGCYIEAIFVPNAGAPNACANWWQILDTSHPPLNCGASPDFLTTPYVDTPYSAAQPHPRYNQPDNSQHVFFDRPQRPKSLPTVDWFAETYMGIEKGDGTNGTFFVPGGTEGFRWGFEWDQATSTVTVKALMQTVGYNETQMNQALTNSCFSGWDMKIQQPVDPCIEILEPLTSAPALVGPYTDPREMKAKVRIGPDYTSGLVSGLTASKFLVVIDTMIAAVATATEKSDHYELRVEPPDSADGIPRNDKYNMKIVAFSGNGPVYQQQEDQSVEYTDERSSSIGLVIDRSGSMGSYGYMEPAKSAASQFVELMVENDQVAVVSFSTSASVDFPLTTITSPQVKESAQAAIANIFSGGGTSIGSGMSVGQGQLDGAEEDHAHAQILLSDGQENEPPWIDDILPTIPQRTDIYTIALGSGADEAKLQQVATATGGQYFLAPSASELQLIYNLIQGAVGGNQIISSSGGSVAQGATSSQSAFLDNTVDNSTFFLGWGGSDLDLTLVTPSGATIDSATAAADSDIEYISAETYEYYIINSPEGGRWDARVYGEETSYPDEAYSLSVTGETDLRVYGSFYDDNLEVKQPINLLVTLTNGGTPVTEAVVVGQVTPPVFSHSRGDRFGDDDPPYFNTTHPLQPLDSDSVITLLDDGAHGDGAADDGVYGAIYTNTSVPGSYIFDLHASGTTPTGDTYTRETLSSIFMNSSQADSTGTIGGTINANLNKTAYVRAWIDDIQMTGQPDYVVEVTPDPRFPTDWVLDDVPTGNYNIDAFLDRDGDGGLSEDEPQAVYAASDTLSSFYLSSNDSIMGVDITLSAKTFSDTDSMRVYPNPYRPESTADGITFDKLPLEASVNIYTVAGELVREGTVSDDALWLWDLKNDKGDDVARGVYLYFINCSDCGGDKTGKVAIIR